MGFMNEFPRSRTFDSDLAEIIALIKAVEGLPKEWESFKKSIISQLDAQVRNYLDMNLETLLARYVYDVSYDKSTETIKYVRKDV